MYYKTSIQANKKHQFSEIKKTVSNKKATGVVHGAGHGSHWSGARHLKYYSSHYPKLRLKFERESCYLSTYYILRKLKLFYRNDIMW